MAGLYINEKIRILRKLLDLPNSERLDSEGKSNNCKDFSSNTIKLPYGFVARILNELELSISNENNLGELCGDSGYWFEVIIENEDTERLLALLKKYEKQSKGQLEFLCKPENKKKISLLQKTYQQLENVVFLFCKNPIHPTLELNENFRYLYNLIDTIINELESWQEKKIPLFCGEHFACLPFSDLFSAEKICKEQGIKLDWQKIRPEMYAIYGDIEEIYQEIGGSDDLIELKEKEKINKIQLFVSDLKRERDTKKMAQGHGKNGDRAQNQNKVNPKISLKLKSGNLSINQKTGEVKLNKVNVDFNPISKEFKILLNFTKNPDKQCKYEELIDGSVSIISKRLLTFHIRKLKVMLGILPAKNRKNKDIFKNDKGFGYRLI